MMDVINSLKKTKKGRLKYDREALIGSNAKGTIGKICDGNLSICVNFFSNESQLPERSVIYAKPRPETYQRHAECYESQLEVDDSFNDIMHYENNRKSNVRNLVDLKTKIFSKQHKDIKSKAEQSMKVLNHDKALREMKREETLKHQHAKGLEEVHELQEQLQESNRQHMKLMNEKIEEAERKQKLVEEREKALELERQSKLRVVTEGLTITSDFLTQMKFLIDNCKFKSHISPECFETVKLVETNYTKMKNVVDQAGCGFVWSDEDISLVQSTVASLSASLQIVNTYIGNAEAKAAEEELRLKIQSEADEKGVTPKVKVESSNNEHSEDVNAELQEYVAIECLKNYVRLKENLKTWKDEVSPLVNNPNLKKYRFDLQKAVNITVNAIGKTSGSHLKDKLNRLHNLMLGNPVEVGNKKVSTGQHEHGLKFCKELLAKKIVRQGEEQVASNHDSAFAFASVIVAMSIDFPDVGDLIVAHFYERCPYLVPYYIPKQEGQSEEDHYRELGYNYVDSKIERQDKFLKRMSGIMRLYAAVVVSKPPPKQLGSVKYNVYGLRFGWLWVAHTLNLDPRPDITATMLFNFLEVAGHAMSQSYKSQFQKLLHAMCREFFPKIKAVTPDGSSGPVLRLETLLQKAISKQGHFPLPEGYLDSRFWST